MDDSLGSVACRIDSRGFDSLKIPLVHADIITLHKDYRSDKQINIIRVAFSVLG